MASSQVVTTIVESVAGGYIQVRHETIFFDDNNVEIGRRFHRVTYPPGSDISAETDPRIQALAAQVWTPAVLQRHRAAIAASHLVE